MKYLGVKLDNEWSWRPHILYAEEKANKVAQSLARLMPNLRGPGEDRRRLYTQVLHSVILYGAPVWANVLMMSPRTQIPLRRAQRLIAQRAIAAYRTVFYAASTLLARTPPVHLLAIKRSKIFLRLKELKEREDFTKALDI